jgi:CRP-like cAMP-binding protein
MIHAMKKEDEEPRITGTTLSEKDGSGDPQDGRPFRRPAGLRRTLSTELVTKQAEFRTLMEVNGLIESRTWAPGETIIKKGDTNRDLFFLTKGLVDIWVEEEAGCLMINQIESPNILGDVGFLSGLPRTATAKANTEVRSFILKYENFMNICKGTPEWLAPLLSAFVSGIKALHFRITELQDKT